MDKKSLVGELVSTFRHGVRLIGVVLEDNSSLAHLYPYAILWSNREIPEEGYSPEVVTCYKQNCTDLLSSRFLK